jgi:hypothetical protein
MQLAEPSVVEFPLPPGASPAPVLECRGLRKRFGELEAVRGISLDIAPGETYGLLGPERRGQDDDDLDGLRAVRTGRR